MAMGNDRLALVAQLAASYLRRNPVAVDQIATVVRNTTEALAEAQKRLGIPSEPAQGSGAAAQEEAPAARAQEPPRPAVPIEQSIQRDHLVCLEDGQHVRTLKRHLRSAHGMTPQQYRARWNLPRDYPMSAPAYSESRSALAKARGLGRKAAPEKLRGAAATARPARAAAKEKPRRGGAKT
jgi:MucR family transcriptional regulator, transcriptional regulator of exopolysaccharide biosynthesis